MVDASYRVRPDHFLDAAKVANVANHWYDFQIGILLAKLLIDLEKLALRLIQEHQFFGAKPGSLAAKF